MEFKIKIVSLFTLLFMPVMLVNCTPTAEPTQIMVDQPTLIPTPESSSDPTGTRVRDGGMVMVYVPAGEFQMGSSDDQLNQIMQDCANMYGASQECQQEICWEARPAHTISLDSFWIDQTEVTNAMYTQFLNEQGNQSEEGVSWLEPGAGHRGIVYGQILENDGVFVTRSGYEEHPVIEVSWYGAAAYCAWVGGRLPTEAEWEYAARGPGANIYPWGNTFDGERTNYCDRLCSYEWHDTSYNDGAARWAPVGSYPDGASWVGALDLAGNVHEWVGDWWSESYYRTSPAENPTGPETGTLRISRGGSWFDRGYRMSSSGRKALTPSSVRMHWVGFRCVMTAQ